jgi:predicted nucleic acid-binding protein
VKFLLDTNVISEIRKRDRAHANVARWVKQTPAREIGTSVFVLAEIRRGIELKRRKDPSRQLLSIDGLLRCAAAWAIASFRWTSLLPKPGRSSASPTQSLSSTACLRQQLRCAD